MTEPVVIEGREGRLSGDLGMPDRPEGIVVFVHGSGSSRLSRRNRAVAQALRQHGLATLLMDLLTEDEERVDVRTRELRFDIDLLADRVGHAVDRIREHDGVQDLAVGLFGASTGAAAALVAAAREHSVRAVVSRGGRPDLAAEALGQVVAPTLLVVGSLDQQVLDLNREAAAKLAATHRIEIVDGATHLFEEPGALDQVAYLAAGWFREHLRG